VNVASSRNGAVSITDLANDRDWTTCIEQELPELGRDVFVAATNQKLDVQDHIEHDPERAEWLRLDSGSIAVVDAVVPALEDLPKPAFHSQGLSDRPPTHRQHYSREKASASSL